MCAAPIFQVMSSSSSSTAGRTPVAHNTLPAQAAHDTVRSISLTAADSGSAARITRATSRIRASDTSAGITSLNTAAGTSRAGRMRLAPKASNKASTGNNTPS